MCTAFLDRPNWSIASYPVSKGSRGYTLQQSRIRPCAARYSPEISKLLLAKASIKLVFIISLGINYQSYLHRVKSPQ